MVLPKEASFLFFYGGGKFCQRLELKKDGAILKLLVQRLRESWPGVRIVFRADSGFCRWKMLRWCESHGVDYIVGLAKNDVLLRLAGPLIEQSQLAYEQSEQKQRLFDWIGYGARSWNRKRRMIAKAEYSSKGRNPRFVVSHLHGSAQSIYEQIYCARGEMENSIKEQQLGLFADPTSSHRW